MRCSLSIHNSSEVDPWQVELFNRLQLPISDYQWIDEEGMVNDTKNNASNMTNPRLTLLPFMLDFLWSFSCWRFSEISVHIFAWLLDSPFIFEHIWSSSYRCFPENGGYVFGFHQLLALSGGFKKAFGNDLVVSQIMLFTRYCSLITWNIQFPSLITYIERIPSILRLTISAIVEW